MYVWEFTAIAIYFAILMGIGLLSVYKRRHLTASDFIIGGRGLNYWLTALAAHASDMSSWLFMGYPAVIYANGLIDIWTAVGLIGFMYLNWQLVAPKIRVATEQYNSMTFSSYFENRVLDQTGYIRIFTAIIQLIFYTIYISAGLVGLGLLLNTLFDVPAFWGIIVGILIVVPYVFIGGYTTLAWIDLFQGLFLMCVIIFVPFWVLPKVGGWEGVKAAMQAKNVAMHAIPDYKPSTLFHIITVVMGWGLGYFGQPHIVTKFMGIRKVGEISKSKWVGMSWMTLALIAATFVGLVAIAFFGANGPADNEQIFIEMVRRNFHPFVIGFFLCAVLAATINAMSSQVLVLTSSITEDFYKRLFRRNASSDELLLVSRMGVIIVGAIAFLIAITTSNTIYSLVLYAWSGLGSAFGPLVLLSLYSRKVNRFGAWAGILSGGIVAGVWPHIPFKILGETVPPLLPGFILSFILIIIVSRLTQPSLATEKST